MPSNPAKKARVKALQSGFRKTFTSSANKIRSIEPTAPAVTLKALAVIGWYLEEPIFNNAAVAVQHKAAPSEDATPRSTDI
jgi:hypothetical protein